MKRTKFGIVAAVAVALTTLLGFAQPASAQVTCQNVNRGSYPADGTHYKHCVPGAIDNALADNIDGAFTGAPNQTETILTGDN